MLPKVTVTLKAPVPPIKSLSAVKHCPFCGGKAVVEQEKPAGFVMHQVFSCYPYYVQCSICHVAQTRRYDSAEDAIREWNKREEPKPCRK